MSPKIIIPDGIAAGADADATQSQRQEGEQDSTSGVPMKLALCEIPALCRLLAQAYSSFGEAKSPYEIPPVKAL